MIVPSCPLPACRSELCPSLHQKLGQSEGNDIVCCPTDTPLNKLRQPLTEFDASVAASHEVHSLMTIAVLRPSTPTSSSKGAHSALVADFPTASPSRGAAGLRGLSRLWSSCLACSLSLPSASRPQGARGGRSASFSSTHTQGATAPVVPVAHKTSHTSRSLSPCTTP